MRCKCAYQGSLFGSSERCCCTLIKILQSGHSVKADSASYVEEPRFTQKKKKISIFSQLGFLKLASYLCNSDKRHLVANGAYLYLLISHLVCYETHIWKGRESLAALSGDSATLSHLLSDRIIELKKNKISTALDTMKLTFFGSIFIALLISYTTGECPTHFLELDAAGACYYFSQNVKLRLTWQEARDFCRTYVGTSSLLTSDLLVLDSTFSEFTAISSYMTNNGLNNSFIGSYDLGLTDLQWAWVDGNTIALNNPLWDCGYPEDSSSEPCGLLAHDSEPLGSGDTASRWRMEDTACSLTTYFICEGHEF